jgi:hypothetical protein
MFPFTGINGTSTVQVNKHGYNLSSPDKTIILPDILREVSGVTVIDSSTIALIQDENGVIFFFNLKENKIKRQIIFGSAGDYEDITLADKTIFVLRSDGTIFEITDFMSKNFKVSSYRTLIPSADNEGLCYDRKNGRLLIGCKGDIRNDKLKNRRAIYSFDLKTRKLLPEPAYVFDPKTIYRSLTQPKITAGGKKEYKDEPEMRISAIGINPVTGKLFLVSALDYMLYYLNISGVAENIESLNKSVFVQAEGLAFLRNGDMLITNEAKGKGPTLLRFNYKPVR